MDVNIKIPAFEKLVDYTASGIGAIAGPILAPWTAQRNSKARLIETKAEADSLRIIAEAQADARNSIVAPTRARRGTLEIRPDGIMQRVEFVEAKRQANIASVVRGAADELGDTEVSDHKPDPDWTTRFFDDVQDVSSKDLQQIWSRILAGEVETPGRTSLRTLSILKNMSTKDASDFSNLKEYTIDNFILTKFYTAAIGSQDISVIVHIQEMGLLHGRYFAQPEIKLDKDGNCLMSYCEHLLLVEGPAETRVNSSGLDLIPLSRSGVELSNLCESKPNFKYLSLFAKFLKEKKCTLKYAPKTHRDSQGLIYCKQNELCTINPAT